MECALKACVVTRFRRNTLPDRKLVNDIYCHDLDRLLDLANLRDEFDREATLQPILSYSWRIVAAWRETSRYDPRISRDMATVLLRSVAMKNGILPWVRKRW